MATRRSTKYIVLHCSAELTSASRNTEAATIDGWHKERGWSDIKYAWVRTTVFLKSGRGEDEVGAQVANHNSNSIGICLVGGLSDVAPY